MLSLIRTMTTTRRMPRALAGSIRTAHLTLRLRPLVVAILSSLCITTCVPSHHLHRPPFHHLLRNTLVALELQALIRAQLLAMLRAQLLPARILRLPASRSLIRWL